MTQESGTVAEFDEAKGFGTVEADGGRRYFFHCTRIAGGGRTIDAGTRVGFSVVAGHLGRWEAADVTPAAPAVGSVPPAPPR